MVMYHKASSLLVTYNPLVFSMLSLLFPFLVYKVDYAIMVFS